MAEGKHSSVPFDAQRRQKRSLLSRLLHLGDLIPDETDMSVLNYIVDYAWDVHKDKTVINRILSAKRGS